MQPIFWLAALILFGVGEAVTVGLTSIWFALGSLGARLYRTFSNLFYVFENPAEFFQEYL